MTPIQIGSSVKSIVFMLIIVSLFVATVDSAAELGPVAPSRHGSISEARPVAVMASASLSVPSSTSVANWISGEPLKTRSGVGFAKLLIHFEPAIEARKVALESCSSDFRDGVEFFAYPGTRRVYVEGGVRTAVADFGSRFSEISAIAVNLRGNAGLCLKGLRFMSAAGGDVPVRVSRTSSSTSLPVAEFEKRRDAFAKAGLDGVIDQELVPESLDDGKWIFRLRGDGTFFVFGRSDDLRTGGRFSAIGEYQIQATSKSRVRLSLNGRRFTTSEPWDGGWNCRLKCADRESASALKIDEIIEIEKLAKGGYMVRNRAPARSRTLHFSDLHVTVANL